MRSVLMMVAVLAAVGCGSAPPLSTPETVKFTGRAVQSTGQPLPGGRIVFKPTEAGRQEATAEVGADGTFTLTSYRPADGAAPGKYTVVVELVSYKGGSATPVRASVPRKYLDARTSDLVVEVKPDMGPLVVTLR